MNSSASWNERGLSPELYQAAREAALRAGMSVEEWLQTTFGKSAAAPPSRTSFHEEPAGAPRFEPQAPSQRGARLSDTVAKLNARLEQMTGGRAPATPATYAAPEPSRSVPPATEEPGIDQVMAEIAARQRALEESPNTPSLAGLEHQLKGIASQIETLRRPSGVEDAIGALRSDLSEIARALNDAVPRRALEGLQADIHTLAERMDAGFARGADPSSVQGIERRLSDVHERLNALTPAEGLGGLDQRITELSHKMDSMGSGGGADPEMLRYLEAAINELRELSHGVASAEGLAVLAGDIQALGERIDHVAQTTGATGLDALAHRVTELTHALDTRVETLGPMPKNLASLVQSLTDKLNGADTSARDEAAFAQLEQRIMGIADRLETADQRSGELSAIERGISQLTTQVRQAREEAVATAERVALSVTADASRGSGNEFRRDLEALHAYQTESDKRTQDTLEALHETLGELVERLANVETGMRSAPAPVAVPVRTAEPMYAPEAFAPREPAMAEPRALDLAPAMPAEAAASAGRAVAPFAHVQRTERPPIAPELPADTPLEPGAARGRSPAERIAASEAALGPALGNLKRDGEVTGKANFIAAARRAAQAAASEGGAIEAPRTDEGNPEESPTSLIGRFLANRRRALMIGVSALLVIYGGVQLMGMLGGGSDHAPEPPQMTPSELQPAEPRPMVAPAPAQPPAPTEATPKRQSSTQPLVAPTPTASLIAPSTIAATAPANEPALPAADVTGSVKQTAPTGQSMIEKVPAGIAGPALRAAAAAANPAAEYEIGIRLSEGRGAPADLELAAQWFESAANHGLAPAQYRLGSFYEKGQGVKKDLNKARTLYLQAADKGNAKAIHNLAVLYAEGIDGKPDYANASTWFRKAANRGVADSQYNLGILYARGIGVDQNLAESYKWFALAAAQGDQDAGKKRDDVASRLDQQSLTAAKLAVQTFVADGSPDDATNVKAPAGGWDKATATPAAPSAKPMERRKRPLDLSSAAR